MTTVRSRWIFRVTLFVVLATAAGALVDRPRRACAGPDAPAPEKCRDPLAHAPGALFCVRHPAGYALFQSAPTVPNTVYNVRSKHGMEVIVFENWVVISTEDGHDVVPRDRFVYSADEEFQ